MLNEAHYNLDYLFFCSVRSTPNGRLGLTQSETTYAALLEVTEVHSSMRTDVVYMAPDSTRTSLTLEIVGLVYSLLIVRCLISVCMDHIRKTIRAAIMEVISG